MKTIGRALIVLAATCSFVFAADESGTAFDRGLNAGNQNNHEEAINQFTQAVKINPKFALAYYYRGWSRAELGDYSKAITDFTQAIKIDPNYADAYNSRGYSYAKLGDSKKAMQDAPQGV